MTTGRDWYPCAQCGGGLPKRESACRVSTPDGVCEPCLRVNRAYANLRAVDAEILAMLTNKKDR